MAPLISPSNLPGLFQECDAISQKAQKKYISMTKYVLLLTIATPPLAIFSSLYAGVPAIRLLLIIVLLFSTVLTLILRHRNFEQDWYNARAVAESTKTLAWKFITRTEPYSGLKADQKFLKDLQEILYEMRSGNFGNLGEVKQPISANMDKVRSMDYEQRFKVYLQDRLFDQQKWYSQKAFSNNKSGERWYWIVIMLQTLAIVAAILPLFINWRINLVAILATCAASAYAWLQLKQYKSLAQAYSLTAHELTIMANLSNSVKNDQLLSDYVINAENAISREQTMWIAKRVGVKSKRNS